MARRSAAVATAASNRSSASSCVTGSSAGSGAGGASPGTCSLDEPVPERSDSGDDRGRLRLVERRQLFVEGGQLLFVAGSRRLDVGGLERPPADGARTLRPLELGQPRPERLRSAGELGPALPHAIEGIDGSRFGRIQLRRQCALRDVAAEQHGRLRGDLGDHGFVVVSNRLPPLVSLAGLTRGPGLAQRSFGVGPFGIGRLGELGRSRFDLGERVELVVGDGGGSSAPSRPSSSPPGPAPSSGRARPPGRRRRRHGSGAHADRDPWSR